MVTLPELDKKEVDEHKIYKQVIPQCEAGGGCFSDARDITVGDDAVHLGVAGGELSQ